MHVTILIFLLVLFIFKDIIIYWIYNWKNKKNETVENKVETTNPPLQKNFPFQYQGNTYWYSRSVACALFVYCKNTLGEWCVLANKRGEGCPDFNGYWNGICGYLDWGEDSIECSLRELREETGLQIPSNKVEIVDIDSSPRSNKQNVVILHRAVLEGTTDDWSSFNTENMEEGEVESIKWIPLNEVGDYKWAFDHEKRIIELFNKN